METIRRVLSATNQGRKRIWKTVKKNCFKIGRRSKSQKSTKCTIEIYDDVKDEIRQLDEYLTSEVTMAEINGQEIAQTSVSMNSSAREANELTFGKAEEGVSEQKSKKKRNRAKCRKNANSQEATQIRQDEGIDKKIINVETKSLDQPPNNSLEQSSITKSNIEEEKTIPEVSLDVVKNENNLDKSEEVLIPTIETKTFSYTTAVTRTKNTENNTNQIAESNAPWRRQQRVCSTIENSKVDKIPNSINNFATRQKGRPYISANVNVQGKRIVHMNLAHHEIELDKAEKAWVPTIAMTKTEKNVENNVIEELNKAVQSILSKITPENIDVLIKDFKALTINTIELLEKVVDLVFERAIEERCFVSQYAILCSLLQSLQVTRTENKRTTISFKKLLINKCQIFSQTSDQTSLVKKSEIIESCTDPDEKKKLQTEFEDEERRLRRRSIGNCCFMGELYNKEIINTKIMQSCITNLISKRTEESLECLCNLLKVAGKKLEQSCDLNGAISKIKDTMAAKSTSPRTRFMIQDVLDMRNNKWAPKVLGDKSDVADKKENNSNCANKNRPADVAVEKITETEGRGQTKQPTCLKTSKTKKKKVDCAVKDEMDPAELNDKIRRLCSSVIKEYEQMHNLDDVIHLLVEDEMSVLRTRHQDFVTSTSLMTLDDGPNTRTEAGKLFAELLSNNVLNMTDITRGIDAVLKESDDYLMDYPHFFLYVAAIVAPLLTTTTASFGFCNLKQTCSSIRPNNSSAFFAEIMNAILRSENAMNVDNDLAREFSGALQTYDMWRGQAKHVPLDVFMPDNHINKFFKNDQLGVLLLAMSIYKITGVIEGNKSLYSAIHKWIKKNIDAKIVGVADFVWSLTIAMAIVCSNNDDPNVDFFDRDRSKLIKNYVRSECDFTKAEIQERELQCIRGSRDISIALHEKHKSRDLEFWKSRLLCELCRVGAISTGSIDSCTV